MSRNWVASIALVTAIALAGTSIIQAQELKPMPEDCNPDGRHYNALLAKIQELEKRIRALEKEQPKLAAELRVWIADKRANLRRQRAILLQIAQLEKEIKALLAQIEKIKASDLDPDAKRAAIAALRAKIRRKRAKIAQLKAELALLRGKLKKGAPPGSTDEAAMKYLGDKLDSLTKAIHALTVEWKKGLQAPKILKAIKELMVTVKATQRQLADLTDAVDSLTKRLDKGIKIVQHTGPKPIWAGWHYRFSLSAAPIFLNGIEFVSVSTLANFEAEHVWRNHLGVLFGLSLGGMVTKARNVDGSLHRVYPFQAFGRLGIVGRWKYWGIQVDVDGGWMQSPIVDSTGFLTVRSHAGVEVRPVRGFFIFSKLGASFYLRDVNTTGFDVTSGLGFWW